MISAQLLLNCGQDRFFLREFKEAFFDHLLVSHPDGQFAYPAARVQSYFYSGPRMQIFRHPDGIPIVVQSHQAVFDYHFVRHIKISLSPFSSEISNSVFPCRPGRPRG